MSALNIQIEPDVVHNTRYKRAYKNALIFLLTTYHYKHRQENRRLVGHFYDMKNQFWAVGCGLGWAVE